MPLYEFKCSKCGTKFSVLCPVSQRNDERTCVKCGASDVKRFMGKPIRLRSDEEIAEKLTDPSSLSGIDENDPSSIKKWAAKTAAEMGENIDEEIDALGDEDPGTGME